jgi:methionyl-tRNA formyltransferase
MGTPDFAVASLDILVQNDYNIVGVITAPDKPAGRGRQLQQSAVKKYALEKGLPILQPEKLKSEEFLKELRSLNANLQIVVAFRMLPELVWNMPELGTFNLHASLLPQYRGAAPINHAIIKGEKETGVTTFFLQHEIDTGDIIFQEKVKIMEDDTAGKLHDTLMLIGAGLVLKTVKAIETGSFPKKPQSVGLDYDQIKHAPKIFKEDCRINWQDDIQNVYNKIRGLSPYPTAWTELKLQDGNTTSIKLFFGNKEEGKNFIPGEIISDGKTYLKIACKNGLINLTEIQLSGKNRLKTVEFLKGFKINSITEAF